MRLPTGRCNSPVRAKETPPCTRFVFELKQVVTRQSHRNDHLAFSYTDPGLLSMVRGLNMRRIGEREQASNLQRTSQPVSTNAYRPDVQLVSNVEERRLIQGTPQSSSGSLSHRIKRITNCDSLPGTSLEDESTTRLHISDSLRCCRRSPWSRTISVNHKPSLLF